MAEKETQNAIQEKADSRKKEKHYTSSEIKVQQLISWMVFGGIAMLVLMSMSHFWDSKLNFFKNFPRVLSHLGNASMIAGACFGAGALTGFLFGIPRLLESKNGNSQNGLEQNDNLVQISDWLTKIIVGVGLTQITLLGPALVKIGEKLAPTFNADPISGSNLAIGTVLYFTITGFLSGYLWTRIHFYRLLAQTGRDVQKLEEELEQKEKEISEKEKIAEQTLEELHALDNTYRDVELSERIKLFNNKSSESDDPNAGEFGGLATVNNRTLKAIVTTTTFDNERFNVSLTVESTAADKPLTGTVTFHLHPTFRSKIREVPVENGIAKLNLIAWGAFTVGVECDNGETRLELDLAKLADAPALFKER